MPKKISEVKKKKIIDSFIDGTTINDLSEIFNCSPTTISRYLKISLSNETYKEINKKNNKNKSKPKTIVEQNLSIKSDSNEVVSEKYKLNDPAFIEIAPLDFQIDNVQQQDLSSIPIEEATLPKIVYLIVNKNIELEPKFLNEYPNWQFLSEKELNRKTIEIFFDIKVAKRFCNKDQKVIKVPNTDVFKITASFLKSKGISRIVSDEILIAL